MLSPKWKSYRSVQYQCAKCGRKTSDIQTCTAHAPFPLLRCFAGPALITLVVALGLLSTRKSSKCIFAHQ